MTDITQDQCDKLAEWIAPHILPVDGWPMLRYVTNTKVWWASRGKGEERFCPDTDANHALLLIEGLRAMGWERFTLSCEPSPPAPALWMASFGKKGGPVLIYYKDGEGETAQLATTAAAWKVYEEEHKPRGWYSGVGRGQDD